MKKSVKITLITIAAVLIVFFWVAFGLYTGGVIGFEDGKLRFYFHKDIDDPDNPDTPNNPDEPDEPDIPASTKYTIHLVLPDNTTAEYTYYPASGKFAPKAQDTWILSQEKRGKLYRFDNWYADSTCQNVANIKKLKDGDTVYAKMVEQVAITIHELDPKSSTRKTVVLDKGSMFKIENYVASTEAGVVSVYSDEAKTTKVGYNFIAKESQDVYVLWSTPYSSFEWKIVSGKASVCGYIGLDVDVLLPGSYVSNGKVYEVTKVETQAFYNCTNLTSIIIPDTVTSIGDEAFGGCTSLTSITIGNGVTSIGDVLFSDCSSLQPRVIEGNISYLGNESNPYLYLWKVTDRSQTTYTINSQCKIIGGGAFEMCSNLRSITIPNGVISLGG